MIRLLRSYIARTAFYWATRKLDAAINDARARHGHVRLAQKAKTDAVHQALLRSVSR